MEKLYVDHLECPKCLSKACVPCIRAICESMKINNDHESDPWYLTVTELMQGNQQLPSFIGHCCELKTTIDKHTKDGDSKGNKCEKDSLRLKYDGYLHIPAIQVMIPPSVNGLHRCSWELKTTIDKHTKDGDSKGNKCEKDSLRLKYDGYLHIPAIQVMIPPSVNGYIDVHGQGREGSVELPGLLHGVINRENASRSHLQCHGRYNIVPKYNKAVWQ